VTRVQSPGRNDGVSHPFRLSEANPLPETEPSIQPTLAAQIAGIIEVVPADDNALALEFFQRELEPIAKLFW